MGVIREEPDRGGIAAHLSHLADALGSLLVHHLRLARVELGEDVRSTVGPLTRAAIAVPFVLVGYGLLCAGLAVLLSRSLPLDASLLIVGGANLTLGALGLLLARLALKRRRVLDDSLAELKTSAAVIASQVEPPHALENVNGR